MKEKTKKLLALLLSAALLTGALSACGKPGDETGGELELDREIRRQYPELSLGPAYTREDGYNRIGVTGSLTLPFWNRNRVGIATATGGTNTIKYLKRG